jgi:non-ribosomal peptide synthetase component F
VYQSDPYADDAAGAGADDVSLETFDVGPGAAKLDLALVISAAADRLNGTLVYAADRFARASIDKVAADFAALVDEVTRDPDTAVRALAPPVVGDACLDRDAQFSL